MVYSIITILKWYGDDNNPDDGTNCKDFVDVHRQIIMIVLSNLFRTVCHCSTLLTLLSRTLG